MAAERDRKIAGCFKSWIFVRFENPVVSEEKGKLMLRSLSPEALEALILLISSVDESNIV